MSTIQKFTVFDAVTGDIKRSGYCSSHLVARHVGYGEGVVRGVQGNHVEDKVVGNALVGFSVGKRPAAEVEARREAARPKGVDPLAVVVEALKAKGITLSEADLTAAAQAVKARRMPPADSGKKG